MSNDNDDATQLGSIRHHMNKPQQPGNPQARPAFQAPSLPTHPQKQSGDDEGTVLRRIQCNALQACNAYGSNNATLEGATGTACADATTVTAIAANSGSGIASQARAASRNLIHDVRPTRRHHRIPQPVHQTGRQRLPGCGRQGAADPPMCHRHDRWRPHSA